MGKIKDRILDWLPIIGIILFFVGLYNFSTIKNFIIEQTKSDNQKMLESRIRDELSDEKLKILSIKHEIDILSLQQLSYDFYSILIPSKPIRAEKDIVSIKRAVTNLAQKHNKTPSEMASIIIDLEVIWFFDLYHSVEDYEFE